MARKKNILIPLLILVLLGAFFLIYLLNHEPEPPQLVLVTAARREIKVVVSTNGIIEPAGRSEVYAPVDGTVALIPQQEGSEIEGGRLLVKLESEQVRTALTEARTALLQEKRQARAVTAGPSKEEIAALDASFAESEMQLKQQDKDLREEEALFSRGATPRVAVENLRKQRDLLQLRLEALKQKKLDLHERYSTEEKEWERDKIAELNRQVELLEQQLRMESVLAPRSGLIFSIPVKPGAFVTKGQLLAQIYQPGRIQLRAYVDEPDLGRIHKGQPVLVEWDGLPDRKWTGMVEKPAKQVVPLNNRSVGHVLCALDGAPAELIPNLNVKVEIVTAQKKDALVIPRAAVFNRNGQPTVMVPEAKGTALKPVELGLAAPEEIEILQGIPEGSSVVLNHGEAGRF